MKNELLFSSETEGGIREGGKEGGKEGGERESSTLQCAMLLPRIRSLHQPLSSLLNEHTRPDAARARTRARSICSDSQR